MKRTTFHTRLAVGIALASALVPGTALAAGGAYETAAVEPTGSSSSIVASVQDEVAGQHEVAAANVPARRAAAAVQGALAEQVDKVLAYDPAAIAAIGTQASTGHTICCPSFSCAYADAVMDGTIHDHSYYVCSCCMWTDWGGGNSSFRVVGSGSDEDVLREAYDQIAAGRPTVVHVAASYGEHWIALIGYQGASDPDHLTLGNFVALDPWDGAQITASDRFALYGDGCQHVSER